MDGRIPQPSDRRVVSRQEPQPAYRQPEEPQRQFEEPVRRAPQQRGTDRASRSKSPWIIASALVVVALLAFVGWMIWSNARSATTGIDSGKFQTVYLMNGQIYFGKLSPLGDSRYKLTNVYYLQSDTSAEAEGNTANAANNNQLIKLSNAIYGPEDEMVISKDQVLYFQNLQDGGRAAQLIKNDQ